MKPSVSDKTGVGATVRLYSALACIVVVGALLLAVGCGSPSKVALVPSDVVGTYRVVMQGSDEFLQLVLSPDAQWNITAHKTKGTERLSGGMFKLEGDSVLFTSNSESGVSIGHLTDRNLVVIDPDGRASTWMPQ